MASSCEEIDAALARLGGKVDGLNGTIDGLKKKLDALEKEQAQCCKDKSKAFDPKEIYKRLGELEDAVRKIVDYIKITDAAIKAANTALDFIVNLFKF
jgi:hypothetical protein